MFNIFRECKQGMKEYCAKYDAKCGFDNDRLGCYKPTGFLGLGREFLDMNAYKCERNKRTLSTVKKKADSCDIAKSSGSGTCGKKDGSWPRPCTYNTDCDKGDTCNIPHQCTGGRFCAQVDDYGGICLNESQLNRQTKCHNVRKDSNKVNDNGRQMYSFKTNKYYCASNDPYC